MFYYLPYDFLFIIIIYFVGSLLAILLEDLRDSDYNIIYHLIGVLFVGSILGQGIWIFINALNGIYATQ